MSPAEQTAEFHLRTAALCFRQALAGDQLALAFAEGLDHVCAAALTLPQLSEHAGAARQILPPLMLEVAPALSEAVADRILAETIYFAAGSAAGLITASNPYFDLDRIAYAGMLSAELRVFEHQRGLRERGSPLMRAIAIRRAIDTPPSPGQPLH